MLFLDDGDDAVDVVMHFIIMIYAGERLMLDGDVIVNCVAIS